MPIPNTFQQLITPLADTDVLQSFLTSLAGRGLPTIAWQSGGLIYTILRIEALAIVDLLNLVASVAKGGLLDWATGDWLTLLAQSAYQLTRNPAQFAQGNLELTVASGSGPYSINPGQLWAVATDGQRYNSANGGVVVLPAGPSNTLVPFRAEFPGAQANLAISTPLTLATPLPGATAGFHDNGSGVWMDTQGADTEADAALIARCKGRWATIGLQKTRDGYAALAELAPSATQVTRVYTDTASPRGPGTVNVWLAGPAGPLPTLDETAVRAYVQARASAAADVQVSNAIATPFNVTAVVTYKSTYTSAVSQATDNVTTLIQETELGGTIYKAAIIEQLMLPQGVVNVTVSAPAGDTTIANDHVFTLGTLNITGSAV